MARIDWVSVEAQSLLWECLYTVFFMIKAVAGFSRQDTNKTGGAVDEQMGQHTNLSGVDRVLLSDTV